MAKVPTVKCQKDVLTSIMDPLPRPPTPPKPEGRDPQLDSKIDDSEEKIRLMRGLNSFGTQIPSFLVDLILVEERIEDAVKTKRMVDMPALMALVEQIAKRTLSAKVGSDSTSSQGAQDLNDLLGLLKGAVFVRGQWRNLRQLHQDR
uniref:Uncharacterized protein n=1 Tax=Fagus sylvatica TaxID=28930 RepID=A0A2N9IQA5_FAGSY